MRKLFTSLFILLLLSIFNPNQAVAAVVVKISDTTHRLSDGVFINDELVAKLKPSGELGSLVFMPNNSVRVWQVDPATISEIVAMSNGYGIADGSAPGGQEIAKQWLTQFKKVTRFEKVAAITYGSPSLTWINKLIPDQLPYLNAVGKLELESVLGRVSEPVVSPIDSIQKIGTSEISIIKYAQKQLNLLATVVEIKELEPYQLRLAQLLNPGLTNNELRGLVNDFDKSITKLRSKLKITGGKFTVTAARQELPITVVNNFDLPVNLKLSIRPINNKVVATPLKQIEVAANSKLQVMLPIEVFASGDSQLLAQLTNLENKPVGYPLNIKLKLSVISPITTWITSGAAVLLFIAVLLQSLRRVRGKGVR